MVHVSRNSLYRVQWQSDIYRHLQRRKNRGEILFQYISCAHARRKKILSRIFFTPSRATRSIRYIILFPLIFIYAQHVYTHTCTLIYTTHANAHSHTHLYLCIYIYLYINKSTRTIRIYRWHFKLATKTFWPATSGRLLFIQVEDVVVRKKVT